MIREHANILMSDRNANYLTYGWGIAIANMADLGAAIFVSVGWTKMCVAAVLA